MFERVLDTPLKAVDASLMTSQKTMLRIKSDNGTFWSVIYPKSNYFIKCPGILPRKIGRNFPALYFPIWTKYRDLQAIVISRKYS